MFYGKKIIGCLDGKVRHEFGKNCAIVKYLGTHIKIVQLINILGYNCAIVTWKMYLLHKIHFSINSSNLVQYKLFQYLCAPDWGCLVDFFSIQGWKFAAIGCGLNPQP